MKIFVYLFAVSFVALVIVQCTGCATHKPKAEATSAVEAKAPESVPSCSTMLDTLAPSEAADCIEPMVSRAVVFIEIPLADDAGPIQMILLINNTGRIVTYNRHEFLTSPWIQILLKRLVARELVEKQWFTPVNPIDGLCT